MPGIQKRPDLQSLYPEPLARSGMDAREPVKFSVPIVKTTVTFFIPVFVMTSLTTLYVYSGDETRAELAISTIALLCFIILAVLLAVVMLVCARAIIMRNSARPVVVEFLYALVLVPAGFVLTEHFPRWLGAPTLYHLIAAQAGILLGLSLMLVLIARFPGR